MWRKALPNPGHWQCWWASWPNAGRGNPLCIARKRLLMSNCWQFRLLPVMVMYLSFVLWKICFFTIKFGGYWCIPYDDAIKYLQCLLPQTSTETVTKAVDLVGGWFADLIRAKRELKSGQGANELQVILFHTYSENYKEFLMETLHMIWLSSPC